MPFDEQSVCEYNLENMPEGEQEDTASIYTVDTVNSFDGSVEDDEEDEEEDPNANDTKAKVLV